MESVILEARGLQTDIPRIIENQESDTFCIVVMSSVKLMPHTNLGSALLVLIRTGYSNYRQTVIHGKTDLKCLLIIILNVK